MDLLLLCFVTSVTRTINSTGRLLFHQWHIGLAGGLPTYLFPAVYMCRFIPTYKCTGKRDKYLISPHFVCEYVSHKMPYLCLLTPTRRVLHLQLGVCRGCILTAQSCKSSRPNPTLGSSTEVLAGMEPDSPVLLHPSSCEKMELCAPGQALTRLCKFHTGFVSHKNKH